MTGPGFVVVEVEFALGRFEIVLDRPAVACNLRKRVDPSAGWAPIRAERQFAVRDMSSDQQVACPQPCASFILIDSLDVGEFEIGPLVQYGILRALDGRQAMPGGAIEILGDLTCSAKTTGY